MEEDSRRITQAVMIVGLRDESEVSIFIFLRFRDCASIVVSTKQEYNITNVRSLQGMYWHETFS